MITVADDGRQMDRPEMSAQQVGYVMFQVKVIGIIGKITCGVEVQNGRFVPVFMGKLSRQLATVACKICPSFALALLISI